MCAKLSNQRDTPQHLSKGLCLVIMPFRKLKVKTSAPFKLGFEFDAPAVLLDNRPGDTQPQADAALLTRIRRINMAKLLKETVMKFFWNPGTMISHRNLDCRVPANGRNFYHTARWRKLCCV